MTKIINLRTAAIIGNGVSRKGFDLQALRDDGLPIFGCNALYRDFMPDYLFAIDDKMVEEIKAQNLSCFVETPHEEQFEPAEANPNRPRNNAGMIAMEHAIKLGYKELFLFGFDFVIEQKELNEANLYAGSNGYGPETHCSYEDTKGRCRYFNWFANKYASSSNDNVMFKFMFPAGHYTIRLPQGLPNVEYLSFVTRK